MRESELKERIEELAEEQGEEERQRGKRRRQERQTLEEIRQRRLEQLKEKCEEKGLDPDLVLTLFGLDEELAGEKEDLEARREELIDQGEDVDLPNETSAFLDGATFQSDGLTAYRPTYGEIRDLDGELEYSDWYPESIDVRVLASDHGAEDSKIVNWWFSFKPASTKMWEFSIIVPYRGFYAMRASPPGAEATLHLAETYRALQYNWGPQERQIRLLQIRNDANIQTRFDRILSGHYTHVLAGGDHVIFEISQRLDVYSRGSGTWSELNFGTGNGNRLPAPYFYLT